MSVAADTIYAPASGALPSAIAVLRLSGPRAIRVAERLAGRTLPPRRAVLVELIQPETSVHLDSALVLAFPGPASATGEDVAELHLHGGRAVVAAVLDALAAEPGLRAAAPGEFARRAFRHGKLDLAAVEGLADLVAAETEAQRRQALRHAGGVLGAAIGAWQGRLARALALSEAMLDFPDEDLPPALTNEIKALLLELRSEIAAALAGATRGERLREGFTVALLGAPNAGKSSLLNAFAGREAAIVAPEPGTTRDVIEVALDLGGWPVRLLDTAGLRDGGDRIEAEGMRRARAASASADLCLILQDGNDPAPLAGELAAMLEAGSARLLVVTKSDLPRQAPLPPGIDALSVSVQSGDGLAALEARIGALAAEGLGSSGSSALFTRARHRDAAAACLAALDRAEHQAEPELAAEDLRLAMRALGVITGAVDVEALLDIVFRELCIGK